MNPRIGVDTLHLNPVQFDLDAHFTAKVKPATFDSGSGDKVGNFPLYRVAGQTFEGTSAFLALENCTLDFNPYTNFDGGTSHVSTKITLTVPKVLNGDNYETADREQTRQALEKIESELSEAGFKFDVKAALVKRLDLAKTLENRDEWTTYRPLLDVFKPSRMVGVSFDTGKRWGNSRRQICLYDKVEEIASRHPKSKRAEIFSKYPKNSMRAELRLTERESFQTATGMRTTADLLADFGHAQAVYRSEFEKKLFRFKASEVEKLASEVLSVESIAAEMLLCIETERRYWLESWIHRDWITARVLDAQRLEVIKAAIKAASEEAGLAKQNVAKQQKRVDSLFLQHAKADKSKRTVSDLYRELKGGIISD